VGEFSLEHLEVGELVQVSDESSLQLVLMDQLGSTVIFEQIWLVVVKP
jgi:hypothetical protein